MRAGRDHKRIDAQTRRLDLRRGGTHPTDLNAVEEALRIKEAGRGRARRAREGVDSLRKALAMGADRAILVTDVAAAGPMLATSSAGCRVGTPADLILFGQASSDGDGSVLWAVGPIVCNGH
jgi:electron transfer flavoprotein beta subunit